MEFGDIIYFILLVFFMILGFFNDSRKKKNLQKKQTGTNSVPVPDKIDETFYQKMERQRNKLGNEKTTPPPALPPTYSGKEVHTQFQSSMDLVTDFKKESSLKSSIFVFDADSSFAQESDSSDDFNSKRPAVQKGSSVHPLVRDLLTDGGMEELKKGLIYGEILQRKY
jgi:hypothetical protein